MRKAETRKARKESAPSTEAGSMIDPADVSAETVGPLVDTVRAVSSTVVKNIDQARVRSMAKMPQVSANAQLPSSSNSTQQHASRPIGNPNSVAGSAGGMISNGPSVGGIGSGQSYPNQSFITQSTHAMFPLITEEHRRLCAVMIEIAPVRGRAVVAMAEELLKRRRCGDFATAFEMAQELLAPESPAVCETVTTLLDDGWEEGVGLLLAAARSL